jgi:hypothetical protein
MRRIVLTTLFFLFLGASVALAGGEIYGTVTTVDGDQHTGPIRWDKNENFWDDMIDAVKMEGIKVEKEGGVNIRAFGMQIVTADSHGNRWVHAQFTIPVGHLASIEPTSGKEVLLKLKNGELLEVRESVDMGSHMRGIVVETESDGEADLEWSDIDRIEFSQGPGGRDQDRLYGTVETDIGEFTGYIVWDKDESLGEDVLDGEADGRDREVPMKNIRSIEKAGNRGSLVTLKSGKELELRGTNDVDDDNRGITITIAAMGRVSVDWDEFRRVTFKDPPPSLRYDQFDGGHPLTGTLTTQEGQAWTGQIIWDRDESYSWECIDGEIKDVQFEIQFQYIARIERASSGSAKVILRDGLEFKLRDSNDVNDENKGILIRTDDGEEIEIGWNELDAVEFSGS